jgi:TetR/AcrR family transcriptional regulator, transcriptional repressor for nem operon
MSQRRGPGSRADSNHPTRHQLLHAAAEVAERVGVSHLSINDITREAGLAKGTFYIHFADRDAIIVDLHRTFHDRLFERIRLVSADTPPGRDRAETRLRTFLDGCRAERGVRSMLFDARAEPAIMREVDVRNRLAATTLAEDLRVANPQATAALLVAAAVEVARGEMQEARVLPALRQALFELVGSATSAVGSGAGHIAAPSGGKRSQKDAPPPSV